MKEQPRKKAKSSTSAVRLDCLIYRYREDKLLPTIIPVPLRVPKSNHRKKKTKS